METPAQVFCDVITFPKLWKGGVMMTGCPMAYRDQCNGCDYFGNCAPSQTIKKIESLEQEISELKALLKKALLQKVV